MDKAEAHEFAAAAQRFIQWVHEEARGPDRHEIYALVVDFLGDERAQRSVVEFLLTRHPNLQVTEPCFHATALGVARYHGRTEMVALLTR